MVYKNACLTQLVEYRFCKPNVIGSSPVVGFFFFALLFFNLLPPFIFLSISLKTISLVYCSSTRI